MRTLPTIFNLGLGVSENGIHTETAHSDWEKIGLKQLVCGWLGNQTMAL